MCVRHAFGGLLHRFELAHLGECFDNQSGAHGGQLVVQGGCGVLRQDGQSIIEQHVARVQARIHLHDGDTRLCITRLNGAVNGGCAAPTGQQRSVNVEATVLGCIKHPLRQDQTIGRHHHHIGLRLRNEGLCCSGFFGVFAIQLQTVRLHHGQVVRECKLFDSGGLQLHAAAGRTIGLCENTHDLVTCGMQSSQCAAGKFGGARKYHAHGTAFS